MRRTVLGASGAPGICRQVHNRLHLERGKKGQVHQKHSLCLGKEGEVGGEKKEKSVPVCDQWRKLDARRGRAQLSTFRGPSRRRKEERKKLRKNCPAHIIITLMRKERTG